MFKLIMILGIYTLSPIAHANPLTVEVSRSSHPDGNIQVTWETVEVHNQICMMTNTNLVLTYPVATQDIGIPTPPVGLIQVSTEVMPETPCADSFGPYNGNLFLNSGYSLPSLIDGYYALIVNQTLYGYMLLQADTVELVDQLPQ